MEHSKQIFNILLVVTILHSHLHYIIPVPFHNEFGRITLRITIVGYVKKT